MFSFLLPVRPHAIPVYGAHAANSSNKMSLVCKGSPLPPPQTKNPIAIDETIYCLYFVILLQ